MTRWVELRRDDDKEETGRSMADGRINWRFFRPAVNDLTGPPAGADGAHIVRARGSIARRAKKAHGQGA